jgi:hypothetical protein
MLSWKNVNSIELKWKSSSILCLEMAFAWIFIRSKPLWTGLPELLFVMFKFFGFTNFYHDNGPSHKFVNSKGSNFVYGFQAACAF